MSGDNERLDYISEHIGELEIPDVVWLVDELRLAWTEIRSLPQQARRLRSVVRLDALEEAAKVCDMVAVGYIGIGAGQCAAEECKRKVRALAAQEGKDV